VTITTCVEALSQSSSQASWLPSGCESERDAHRYGVALRRSSQRWNVATFPDFRHIGALIRVRPGQWVILNAVGKTIGHTEGPDGVPAGLVWLISC